MIVRDGSQPAISNIVDDVVAALKRGSGKTALAAAPLPAENAGGVGAYDPLTVPIPGSIPACTHTGKSRFSIAFGFVRNTSQTAVALPLTTCNCTAGIPSKVTVGETGAKTPT